MLWNLCVELIKGPVNVVAYLEAVRGYCFRAIVTSEAEQVQI